MTSKTSSLYIFVMVCILMHETVAERPKACTDPIPEAIISRHCTLLIGFSYKASTNKCIYSRHSTCSESTENFFNTNDECLKTCSIKPSESPTEELFKEIRHSLQGTLDKLSKVEQRCSECKHSEL